MLRECHRVLAPGGRIAGYVIHTPAGLTPAQVRRAAELGPSDVTAAVSPDALAQSERLIVVVAEDVTDAFHATCTALRAARRDLEDELRTDEGDDFYEEERRKKDAMLQGIAEGVLCRSLIVANKENQIFQTSPRAASRRL